MSTCTRCGKELNENWARNWALCPKGMRKTHQIVNRWIEKRVARGEAQNA